MPIELVITRLTRMPHGRRLVADMFRALIYLFEISRITGAERQVGQRWRCRLHS